MSDEEKVKILIEMDKQTYGFIRNLDNLEEKEGIFPSIAAFNTFVEAVRDGKIEHVKEAHWVWIGFGNLSVSNYSPNIGDWICSGCKNEVVSGVRKDDVHSMPFYKYCPHCGARMNDVYGKSEVKNDTDK